MGVHDYPYQNIKAAVAQLEQDGFNVMWSPNPLVPIATIRKGDQQYAVPANELINLYLSGQLNEEGLGRFKEPAR